MTSKSMFCFGFLSGHILQSPSANVLPTLPFHVLRALFSTTPLTTDDGVLLRRMALEIGAIHLILACLSALSHHAPRNPNANSSVSEVRPAVQNNTSYLYSAFPSAQRPLWGGGAAANSLSPQVRSSVLMGCRGGGRCQGCWWLLDVMSDIMKSIWCLKGSQWGSWRIGVMWTQCRVKVWKQTAELFTHTKQQSYSHTSPQTQTLIGPAMFWKLCKEGSSMPSVCGCFGDTPLCDKSETCHCGRPSAPQSKSFNRSTK